MDDSELVKYLYDEIKEIKIQLNNVSNKINSIEKEFAGSFTKIKYYNGKFDEVVCRVNELEKFKENSLTILSRIDKDLLDDLISISKTSGRASRIADTIVASLISGVLVSVITSVVLYLYR